MSGICWAFPTAPGWRWSSCAISLQGIRSVVLDSPFPPNANTPLDEALNVWESLQTLFADCDADDYCRQNYPNLERVFLDTVAELNDQPADDLFGDDFFFTITQALNDTGSIPLLPWAIYAVSQGDYDALDELVGDDWFRASLSR
jgi:hypothetical protein